MSHTNPSRTLWLNIARARALSTALSQYVDNANDPPEQDAAESTDVQNAEAMLRDVDEWLVNQGEEPLWKD